MRIMLLLFFIQGFIKSADQSSLMILASLASEQPYLSVNRQQHVRFTFPESSDDKPVESNVPRALTEPSCYRVPLSSHQAAMAIRQEKIDMLNPVNSVKEETAPGPIRKFPDIKFPCDQCDHKAPSQSHLKRHKTTHSDEKK